LSNSKTSNPNYDELIIELRELKQFIDKIDGQTVVNEKPESLSTFDKTPSLDEPLEGVSDSEENELTDLNDDPAEHHSAHQEVMSVATEIGSQEDNETDDLPLLNVVVSRKDAMKEIQLDLLESTSTTAETIDSFANESDEPKTGAIDANSHGEYTDETLESDFASSSYVTTEDLPAAQNPSLQLPTLQPGGDSEERSTEELTRFVYGLSERILDLFEDKLTERNGEILPLDLRDELKHDVADILYEWCEQSE